MRKLRIVIAKQRNGSHLVRVEQPNGRFRSAGTYATRAEAEAVRDHARALLDEHQITPDTGTFRTYGEALLDRWTEAGKASIRMDRSRWRNHITDARFADADPRCVSRGDLKRFRDDLAKRGIAAKTQREVLLLVRAVFADLIEADVIDDSPMRGLALPAAAPAKAFGYLYPADDAALVSSTTVPLPYRVLWGVLAREGLRKGEALALTWDDVDLERGVIRLDTNKTNDPRAWKLGEDVARTLAWWKERRRGRWVFRGERAARLTKLRADKLREHLEVAGVDRPELFEDGPARRPIRVHDLRATFVTLALAAGRNETWVTDRTGHRSHYMVNRYRRAARTAAELELGWLHPLDELLGADRDQIVISNGPTGPEVAEGGDSADSLKPTAFGHPGSSPGGATAPKRQGLFLRSVTLAPEVADHAADQGRAFMYAALADPGEAQRLAGELASIAEGVADELETLAAEVRKGGPLAVRRTLRLIDLIAPIRTRSGQDSDAVDAVRKGASK